MDVYMQTALKYLGPADITTKMQLIQQFQEKEAADRQERERHAAMEAAERRAAMEAAERQAERESAEREADRRYELELSKLKRQSEAKDTGISRPRPENFPVLEKDGDVDAFLRGFEKTCRQYGLAKDQWAQYLTPGLRGKALEAFADLPPEMDGNYEAIKSALLQRFNITPEAHRQKFRDLKRSASDTYSGLVAQLCASFKQWVGGLQITTFDALQDLMIQEQFLTLCPADVKEWVVDRDPASSAEAARLADKYTVTRAPAAKRGTFVPGQSAWKGERPGGAPSPAVVSSSFGRVGAKPVQGDTRRCFICNRTGHLSAACPDRKTSTASTVGPPPPRSAPAVLCVAGSQVSRNDNLQTVTVGDKVTVGLRDTGADVTLVRSELVGSSDIIPGKTIAVRGVGGIHPAVPMARVYLDWGAGRGLREVGVSDNIPTNVLLGTDLGRMLSRYVASSDVVDSELNHVFSQVSGCDRENVCSVVSEVCKLGCEKENDCSIVSDLGQLSVSKELGDVTISSVSVVTRRQAEKDRSSQLTPEREVESPSDPEAPPLTPLPPAPAVTDALPLSPDTEQQVRSQAFQQAQQTDTTLETLRCLAGSPPTESDKERVFWEQGRLYKESVARDVPEAGVMEKRLGAPDFDRRFTVQTDASNYGLGAVLSQVNQQGEEHPILYLSRKLLPREVAYAVVEKECLAIVWALQKLQSYLYGRDFTVITDHNPLSWLHRVAGDNGKLLRWSLTLQQYTFTVQHRKGSHHGNADGLSRQNESLVSGLYYNLKKLSALLWCSRHGLEAFLDCGAPDCGNTAPVDFCTGGGPTGAAGAWRASCDIAEEDRHASEGSPPPRETERQVSAYNLPQPPNALGHHKQVECIEKFLEDARLPKLIPPRPLTILVNLFPWMRWSRLLRLRKLGSPWPKESLEAQIVLIHKEGKDAHNCASCRPISLLNIDLKLYAKILANRLISVLPGLVHYDQTSSVSGTEQTASLHSQEDSDSDEHVSAPVTKKGFLSLIKEMKELRSSVHAEVQHALHSLRSEVSSLGSRTDHIERKMDDVISFQESTTEDLSQVRQELNTIHERQEDMDNRARRNNLRIKGVPESIEPVHLDPYYGNFSPSLLRKSLKTNSCWIELTEPLNPIHLTNRHLETLSSAFTTFRSKKLSHKLLESFLLHLMKGIPSKFFKTSLPSLYPGGENSSLLLQSSGRTTSDIAGGSHFVSVFGTRTNNYQLEV
ncbi:uncharacterized protein LOC142150817 [Mixophyes fleayi]|uniref:uncharacterized protein LOC142150817 n=1 Tax=Mixophyes fleayi TaxID=3061075 RepID=UPI003F4E31D3